MSENAEKMKALQLTIDKLEKSYGKGAVMKLSDEKVMDIPSIPTGSLGLDIALGIGGVPRGRVVEIYGPESSGKTTLTMHCIAEAQKQGGLAAFIDAEHAFDKGYAEKLGIDTENLLISQPDNGEQALEIADHLISSGAIDIIVIDSVAALVPRAEIEGETWGEYRRRKAQEQADDQTIVQRPRSKEALKLLEKRTNRPRDKILKQNERSDKQVREALKLQKNR